MKKVFVLWSFFFSVGMLSAQCIKGDCKNGQGILKFADGSSYSGNFSNGELRGFGVMTYANGNRYEGTWSKDLRSGKGVLNFTNGDIYAGHFKNDKFSGKGLYKYADGDSYDGEWLNHLAHGKGVYKFSATERYEGQLFKGEFHGVGAFHYADGSIFIGNWKHSKRNGEGKLHYKNGRKLHGIWNNDELVDRDIQKEDHSKMQSSVVVQNETSQIETKPILSEQKYWKDCTSSYCNNENGELIYGDGSRWRGNFINGAPHGQGTLVYANGNRYEGNFSSHAPNGEGVMYFSNGQVMGGTWDNGYPMKQTQQNVANMQKSKVEVDQDDEVKIWAVIIGVSSYSHMPALKYTDDDAYQVYAFLKSPEGGALPNEQIRLLIDENATRQNILAGMNEILLKADENDVVMMYYSGHGLPGMFLPIDFDGYRNNLSHDEIMDVFNNSKAKHKLCIADACHSGSLLASRSPFKQQLEDFYGEYDKTNGGTALIMSSKSEEVSLETSGLRQGIFSHYLIRGLNGEADDNKNKIVTVSELFRFISTGVTSYTANKQQPSIAGSYDKDMPISTVR